MNPKRGAGLFARAPETVEKGLCPFLTKGLQSAARTICTPLAYKSHTCSLSCIFCQVHAPTENDQDPFAACGRQTLRGFFDTLRGAGLFARAPKGEPVYFSMIYSRFGSIQPIRPPGAMPRTSSYFSMKRWSMAAISARVALPCGSSRSPDFPFTRSLPTAHCIAVFA